MNLLFIIQQEIERIGDPSLGFIIPGVILIISTLLTWMLYKKFSK